MENLTRHQWISDAAYFKAEIRNFAPGRELDDWLAAENDYVRMLVAHYLSIAEEDGVMTIVGLKQLAQAVGAENSDGINLKIELIQAIQNAIDHRPCFRPGPGMVCPKKDDCQWKAECRKLIAEWRR